MSRSRYTKKRYEPARQVFSDTGPVEVTSVEDEMSPLEEQVHVFDVEENEQMNIDEKAIQTPSTPSEIVDGQERLSDEPAKTVQVEPEQEPEQVEPEPEETQEEPATEKPTDKYPTVDSAQITQSGDYDPTERAKSAGEFMNDALHTPPSGDNGFTITAEDADN